MVRVRLRGAALNAWTDGLLCAAASSSSVWERAVWVRWCGVRPQSLTGNRALGMWVAPAPWTRAMEHHDASATRLRRSSSFKKLLKLPIWGSGQCAEILLVAKGAGFAAFRFSLFHHLYRRLRRDWITITIRSAATGRDWLVRLGSPAGSEITTSVVITSVRTRHGILDLPF